MSGWNKANRSVKRPPLALLYRPDSLLQCIAHRVSFFWLVRPSFESPAQSPPTGRKTLDERHWFFFSFWGKKIKNKIEKKIALHGSWARRSVDVCSFLSARHSTNIHGANLLNRSADSPTNTKQTEPRRIHTNTHTPDYMVTRPLSAAARGYTCIIYNRLYLSR
jgi:hypothetical protein